MRRGVVVTLMLGIFMLVLGCNPKVGLIALDTRPQGATVYLNETKVGETPVTFEFDMEKPVTLRILKEGYQPKEEKLNVGWVKSEYHQGNYSKGDYVVKGTMQRSFEVHATRDLIISKGSWDREQIRSGVLVTGISLDAFFQEWGAPTRTYTSTGEEITRAGWSAWGGSLVKGKQAYDVWEYEADITLVFAERTLAGWKTEMTVSQLQQWSAKKAQPR